MARYMFDCSLMGFYMPDKQSNNCKTNGKVQFILEDTRCVACSFPSLQLQLQVGMANYFTTLFAK